MAAAGNHASQSSVRTDEETSEPAGKMSEGRSDGDVVQNEEPPKHDEVSSFCRLKRTGPDDGASIRDVSTGGDDAEDEEEEGECGFCLFMKGGPCRETFIAWEDCVEAAEKSRENIVDSCFQVTGLLRSCMEAHIDYYEPILRAEKAMEEEADRAMQQQQQELEPEATTAQAK